MTTLNDRQERFVIEYMKDQNASAAARRCGYSERSAASQGSALMQIPAVRERVRVEMRDFLAELKLQAKDLIRERMRAAFFRSGKMFGPDGQLLAVAEMDIAMRELLDISVDVRNGQPILRLRQPNREKALMALEKFHDKLDRLDEKHWDKLEREKKPAQPPASASAPAKRPFFRLPAFLRDAPVESAPAEPTPAEPAPAQAEPETAEKPHGLSGSGKKEREKPQGLSGSAETKVQEEEPYDFMKDPDACWGGRRKPKPEPEPSPALVEHMARVQMQQHNEEIRQALEARGGKVRPGPGQQVRRPGFDPWAQNRPQYAIGGGEYWVDD